MCILKTKDRMNSPKDKTTKTIVYTKDKNVYPKDKNVYPNFVLKTTMCILKTKAS